MGSIWNENAGFKGFFFPHQVTSLIAEQTGFTLFQKVLWGFPKPSWHIWEISNSGESKWLDHSKKEKKKTQSENYCASSVNTPWNISEIGNSENQTLGFFTLSNVTQQSLKLNFCLQGAVFYFFNNLKTASVPTWWKDECCVAQFCWTLLYHLEFSHLNKHRY